MSMFYDEEHEKLKNSGPNIFKRFKNRMNEGYHGLIEMFVLNSVINLSEGGMMHYPVDMGTYSDDYVKVEGNGNGYKLSYIKVKKRYSEGTYGVSNMNASFNDVYSFSVFGGGLYRKINDDVMKVNVVEAAQRIEEIAREIKEKKEFICKSEELLKTLEKEEQTLLKDKYESLHEYGVIVKKNNQSMSTNDDRLVDCRCLMSQRRRVKRQAEERLVKLEEQMKNAIENKESLVSRLKE